MITAYDAYEIHPVTVFTGKDGQPCHDITTRPEEADLWCLYGHIPGEGLECIGDFPTLADALRVYGRITGLP